MQLHSLLKVQLRAENCAEFDIVLLQALYGTNAVNKAAVSTQLDRHFLEIVAS